MYTNLRFFCALLGMVFNLVYGLPALALDGHGSPPFTSLVKYNQIVAAPTWNGHLPLSYDNFEPFAALDTSTGQSEKGYRWKGPPAENPDWRGIKWDTAYFFAYQFAAIGILYIAPEDISGWTDEDKDEYSFDKWVDNVRNPIWDEDEWWVNYILHPYWGGAYYIRARERGFDRTQSFWYSFLLSTLYEYGLEALFEPVSYQDLVVTPVAGALLGEFVFSPVRERIRAKSGQLDWSDKTLLFFTDPIGVANAGVNRILGINTVVSFRQLRMKDITKSSGVPGEREIIMPARADIKPVWGLQLEIIW